MLSHYLIEPSLQLNEVEIITVILQVKKLRLREPHQIACGLDPDGSDSVSPTFSTTHPIP